MSEALRVGLGPLFEAVRDGVVVADAATGRVVAWNAAAEGIFGYTAEEALGLLIEGLIPESLRAQHRAGLARFRDTGHGPYIDAGLLLELPAVRRGGREITVELSLAPLSGPAQERLVVAVIRDVTERKRLQARLEERTRELTEGNAALQRLAEELQEANQELEGFSYAVSHDLRAPLRAIDGFSGILVEEHAAELSQEARRYLQLARENALLMGQLVDDLLAFSRLSRHPLVKEVTDPAAVAREALAGLKASPDNRDAEVAIAELPRCLADPSLLRQVFTSLLGNALKFTRDRHPASIEVGFRLDDGQTTYFVRDNGVGFDMRYSDKLFGIFQRLHRAEDYEGTGVGLAIVQRIVHRHGGRVWAEGSVGTGATFFFTLGEQGNNESPGIS